MSTTSRKEIGFVSSRNCTAALREISYFAACELATRWVARWCVSQTLKGQRSISTGTRFYVSLMLSKRRRSCYGTLPSCKHLNQSSFHGFNQPRLRRVKAIFKQRPKSVMSFHESFKCLPVPEESHN